MLGTRAGGEKRVNYGGGGIYVTALIWAVLVLGEIQVNGWGWGRLRAFAVKSI